LENLEGCASELITLAEEHCSTRKDDVALVAGDLEYFELVLLPEKLIEISVQEVKTAASASGVKEPMDSGRMKLWECTKMQSLTSKFSQTVRSSPAILVATSASGTARLRIPLQNRACKLQQR
jgi:hypothetical protein